MKDRESPLTRSYLDRVSEKRSDPDFVNQALADKDSVFLPVWRSRNLVIQGDNPKAARLSRERCERLQGVLVRERQPVLLGLDGTQAHFCIDLSDFEEDALQELVTGDEVFTDLRQIGALMDSHEGNLLAYSRGMTHWQRQAAFCGRCGSPTRAQEAGHSMRCSNPDCSRQTFPRSDPAVIMLVLEGESGERALLGRQPNWPPGMYSSLAGFCEPGESLEIAVEREVWEEARIQVKEAHYHSSQPWPFPQSLMLGFHATSDGGEPQVEQDELEDARWFSREDIRELTARRELRLPGAISISRRLIDAWLDDEVGI